jgi:hypothetical protein
VTELPGRVPTSVCAVDDSHRALPVARRRAHGLSRELEARLLLAHVFDAMARCPAKELRLAGTTPQHIADVERQRVRGTTAKLLLRVDPALLGGAFDALLKRTVQQHVQRTRPFGEDERAVAPRDDATLARCLRDRARVVHDQVVVVLLGHRHGWTLERRVGAARDTEDARQQTFVLTLGHRPLDLLRRERLRVKRHAERLRHPRADVARAPATAAAPARPPRSRAPRPAPPHASERPRG